MISNFKIVLGICNRRDSIKSLTFTNGIETYRHFLRLTHFAMDQVGVSFLVKTRIVAAFHSLAAAAVVSSHQLEVVYWYAVSSGSLASVSASDDSHP